MLIAQFYDAQLSPAAFEAFSRHDIEMLDDLERLLRMAQRLSSGRHCDFAPKFLI